MCFRELVISTDSSRIYICRQHGLSSRTTWETTQLHCLTVPMVLIHSTISSPKEAIASGPKLVSYWTCPRTSGQRLAQLCYLDWYQVNMSTIIFFGEGGWVLILNSFEENERWRVEWAKWEFFSYIMATISCIEWEDTDVRFVGFYSTS